MSLPGTVATAAPRSTPGVGADSVVVTGSGRYYYSGVAISTQSGASGQTPTGNAALSVFGISIDGPVTCLRVAGPDRGSGTPGSPTTAVLNVSSPQLGVVTVQLVDNGGNGADIISTYPAAGRLPSDCSPLAFGVEDVLIGGRAIVFDAPLVPTSKEQCKRGGYVRYGFANQGRCIKFVNHQ